MDNEKYAQLAEKARGKTADELVQLALEEGVDLTDEQLEAVSGGWTGYSCPNCGSTSNYRAGNDTIKCESCGHTW